MARQQFPFYKSFDDVVEDLTDAQLAIYIRTLLNVQFLRVKIDSVKFNDKTLSIVWKSQKHSISKSINGFLDGQKRDTIKNPYLGVYDTSIIPDEGIQDTFKIPEAEVKEQVQGKVQGKEEGKGIIVVPTFTFTLSKDTHFSKLSEEYIFKLKDKIKSFNGLLSFIDFEMALLSKSSYKYKDFWLTYQNWNKREYTKQQKPTAQSFKQQDAQKTESSLDAYFRAKEQGLDLRKPNMGMPIKNYEDAEVIEYVK